VRYGGENVSTVRGGAFNAITMVNAAFSRFMVNVKVLQVVVKVNCSCTKITTEKRGMCCEHSSDVDMPLPAKWDGDSRLPFVEVSDNGCMQLT
jgi:hypothetical protein